MSYPPTFLNELSNILGPGYDIDVHGPALHITHTPETPGPRLILNLPPSPFPLGTWGKLRVITTAARTLRLSLEAGRLDTTAAHAREVLTHLESPAVRLLTCLYPDFSVEPLGGGELRVRYMSHFHGPAVVIQGDPKATVMLDAVRVKFFSLDGVDVVMRAGRMSWPILASVAARDALDSLEHGQGTGGDKVEVARSRPGLPTTVAVGVPDGRGGGTVYRGEERSPFDGRSGAPPWTPGTSPMAARLGLGG